MIQLYFQTEGENITCNALEFESLDKISEKKQMDNCLILE